MVLHCGFDLHFSNLFFIFLFIFIYLYIYFFIIIVSYFLATPEACRSSWARDQTYAIAVTRVTALTMPDPQPTEPPENSMFITFLIGM